MCNATTDQELLRTQEDTCARQSISQNSSGHLLRLVCLVEKLEQWWISKMLPHT
jgi:hypothetical protein